MVDALNNRSLAGSGRNSVWPSETRARWIRVTRLSAGRPGVLVPVEGDGALGGVHADDPPGETTRHLG